jgi:4,4-dimethyl-9beta,19-cyclopropylsterol-4alpha-methyl oxidase
VRRPRCLIESRKEKNKVKRKNRKRQDLAGARFAMLPFASVMDAQESLGRNLTYLELQWFRHTSGVSDYILYCYNIVFLFIIFNLAPLPSVLLDVLQVRAAEKYKLQPGVHNSRDAVWKCYKSVMLLFFTVVLPLQLSSFPAVRFVGVRMGFPLPSFAEVVLHLFVYLVVEDYLNYWIHRWLHQGWLYENIHRVHHEFMSPMSFAAPYAHWAEIILLGVPTFMGPAMVPGHIITLWIWIALRQLEAIDTHSGYDFPWNPTKLIPFYGGAEYHDYHHFVGGKSQSNFASVFTYCDWLYGTDKGYRYLKENNRKEMIAKAKLNSLDMGWMEIDSLKPLPNHHWKQIKLS